MTDMLQGIRNSLCVPLLPILLWLTFCPQSMAQNPAGQSDAGQASPPAAKATPTASPDPAPTPPGETPAAVQVADQVTPADLDDLKKRIDASTELNDDQKKAAHEIVDQARGELLQAADLAARLKELQQRTEGLEAARQQAQANLEASLREKPQRLDDLDTLPKLEQALATKQQELVSAQNELTQTEKKIADRTARQKAIKDRLAGVPADLDANAAELSKLAQSTDPGLLVDARKMKLLASRKRIESEPPTIQAESAFLSAQEAANLLMIARQEWTARVARVKSEVASLQREVLRRRSQDANDRAQIADGDAESTDIPQLKAIYRENVAIVEQEIEFREKEKRLKDEIAEAESLTNWVTEKRKDLENRKGKIGTSKSFGIRLRTERRLLPDPRKYREAIAARTQISQDAQLNLIDISSRESQLVHLENQVNITAQQILAQGSTKELTDETRYQQSQLIHQVRKAYEQQQKYLTELQSANESYVSSLDSLDAQQDSLASSVESFQKFIDENILWVPTNNILQLNDVLHDSKSLSQLFSIEEWRKLWSNLKQDAMQNPAAYAAAILVWLAMLVTQGRQRAYIQMLGQRASSRLNTAMGPTWLTIFWTAFKSLISPLPLFFFSWRSSHFGGSLEILSTYLFNIAVWLYWLELVRNTCRDRGLGVAHFQWPERVNRVVTVQLNSFIGMATPVILVVALLHSRTADQEVLPVERLCSVAFLLLLAYSLHRLTSPKTGILREWIELHPGGWLAKLALLWNIGAVALALFLCGLVITGYTYASEQLSVKLAQTLMVVFAALFVRATLLRWLTLRQRRLAINHAREVRAALAEAKGPEDGNSAAKLEAQEARTNLAEVSLQSKRLLNTSVVLLSLACVWFIWIDVLPALQKLDEYSIPHLGYSLGRVLTVGIVGILFTTAARNIPGLLEMLLLERLPLDRSVRYAIGALTRYIIVIVGILTVRAVLNIQWEQVQWLLAALTFGLGFGLQEIFANFISGLIILFEQPVRVGDVVTIDSVSGTVSRIRIRSTTIVDWDRKEYIVPNKEFITGKVLNWTLTDTTNRVQIKVRVSLKSDPVRVREMLLKIAQTQPQVLAEPAPGVIFEGFGDCSLNFLVNVFLPGLEFRSETINQLHVRILQEFNQSGIEISFPQTGLHVRTTVPIPVLENQIPTAAPTAMKSITAGHSVNSHSETTDRTFANTAE